LEEEEEKPAELSEDLLGEVEESPVEENAPTDREDEPLHESELLFRQESFESLSPEELSPDEEAEEEAEAAEIEAPEEEEEQFPNEKKRDDDDKLPL
jgi:hypothetical protein